MAERDYERSDVSPRAVLWTAGILCVSVALIAAVIWLMRVELRDDPPVPEGATALEGVPLQPRLQESPQVDLRQLVLRQRARLTSWGWIDKPAGVAHIPIDAAMALMVDRGWPERDRTDVTEPPPPPPPRPIDRGPGQDLGGPVPAPTEGPKRADETRGEPR